MNRLVKKALLLLVLVPFCIFANDDIDTVDMGSEEINGPFNGRPSKSTPFSVSANFDYIGKSQINNGFFRHDEFQFAVQNIEIGSVIYYCPDYSEAANITLGYTNTYYGWKDNPWFEQKHFDTLTLSLGGLTKRLNKWLWRGQIDVNYDGFEEIDPRYFNYNIIMWGRYDLCQNMGMHLGFFLETGMRMDRIYPILGIDWTFSPKWKLNAVFPFNMSLEYSYNKCLTFALAGRTFSSRNRIQPTDYNNKCVCRYSNFGIEGLIRYEYGNFVANVHAGYTTGGRFRVADEHNHHPHNYDLDPAGYAGAELDLRF